MRVLIKPEADNFVHPKKGEPQAACYDVTASKIEWKGKNLVCVYLGFSTEIPIGFKGVIVPRSSLCKTEWSMQNSPAQIDPEFRGQWMIKFRRFDDRIEFPYKVGDRVAQIFFEKEEIVTFKLSDNLSTTERGAGGFGSTGK